MRLRWLWFDFVPPELGLSLDERAEVQRLANALGRWEFRPAMRFLWMFYLFLGVIGGVYILILSTGLIPRGMKTVFALTGVVPFWVAVGYTWGKTLWIYTWKALRQRGHDVCRDCRYVLRGLDDRIERCPECGWVRERLPGQLSD